ncbi:MAG: hypothetical protein J7K73_01390 [Nanoarchaeota archaeon]|nr:hypothetical protein [Nanoarchaeota archaeon]
MVIKKLQKSGNAYFIYLPVDWARKIKGKEVNLDITSTGIIKISPLKSEDLPLLKKDIVVDSHDLDFIIRHIASLYINGYDEFTVGFKIPLSKKELSKLNNHLVDRGLSQFAVDITSEFVSFKIPPGFLKPLDLGTILLKRVLKLLMAVEQGEVSLANNYRKEYISTMLTFQRMYNSFLQKPHQFIESQLSSLEMLDLLFVLYAAKEIGDWVLQKKALKDIKIIKQILEVLLTFMSNKDFGNVAKLSNLKNKLSDKTLFLFVKIIERTLLNWRLL